MGHGIVISCVVQFVLICPSADAKTCPLCPAIRSLLNATHHSERHRKSVFEREEIKRTAAYELLIGKLEAMASNREAAEARSL